MHVCSVGKSSLIFCDPMGCNPQGPLFMEFPRQEYWHGLPFSSPGYLPHAGTKPTSPPLAGGFFPAESPGKTVYNFYPAIIVEKSLIEVFKHLWGPITVISGSAMITYLTLFQSNDIHEIHVDFASYMFKM